MSDGIKNYYEDLKEQEHKRMVESISELSPELITNSLNQIMLKLSAFSTKSSLTLAQHEAVRDIKKIIDALTYPKTKL